MGKNRVPVDAIRDAMIYFIKERNISVPVVLKTVDISRSRLYDYLQGNGKVSATTLVNLLMTIGVSFDELLLHIYRIILNCWIQQLRNLVWTRTQLR